MVAAGVGDCAAQSLAGVIAKCPADTHASPRAKVAAMDRLQCPNAQTPAQKFQADGRNRWRVMWVDAFEVVVLALNAGQALYRESLTVGKVRRRQLRCQRNGRSQHGGGRPVEIDQRRQ